MIANCAYFLEPVGVLVYCFKSSIQEGGCLPTWGLEPCSSCWRIVKLLSSPPCCHGGMLAIVQTVNYYTAQLLRATWSLHEMWKGKNLKSNAVCIYCKSLSHEEEKHEDVLSKLKCNEIGRCVWQRRWRVTGQRKQLCKHDNSSLFQRNKWFVIILLRAPFLVLTFIQQRRMLVI